MQYVKHGYSFRNKCLRTFTYLLLLLAYNLCTPFLAPVPQTIANYAALPIFSTLSVALHVLAAYMQVCKRRIMS